MRPCKLSDTLPRRRRRLVVEGLESRDLLAAAAAYHPPFPPVNLPPSLVKTLVGEIYGPVTAADGTVYAVPQPTPAEIRRETFYSQWIGHYSIGAPRSTDRADTIRIFSDGNDAGSNQFLKGRTQILLLPPADPSATPSKADPIAGMVVGLEAYFPTNYLQTSGNLLLDITNLPGVASNDPSALSHGLPSRLAWTLDSAGAGVYTQPLYTFDPFSTSGIAPGGAGGAAAWTAGAGIIDLKYLPDRHPEAGTRGSGQVIVKVEGLFNNPGDLNAINYEMNI